MAWAMIDLNGQLAFTMVPCRFPPIKHFQRIADERQIPSFPRTSP